MEHYAAKMKKGENAEMTIQNANNTTWDMIMVADIATIHASTRMLLKSCCNHHYL